MGAWEALSLSLKAKAAFIPGQHVAGNMLLVAVNKIVASFVARLLLDTKGYMLRDTGNMLPATSNMLPGNMLLVAGNMLLVRATCCPGVLNAA